MVTVAKEKKEKKAMEETKKTVEPANADKGAKKARQTLVKWGFEGADVDLALGATEAVDSAPSSGTDGVQQEETGGGARLAASERARGFNPGGIPQRRHSRAVVRGFRAGAGAGRRRLR